MTLTRKTAVSAQILAARQAFTEGVYHVGPYASRVSFSSQQRRAFALVAEMQDDLVRSGQPEGLKGKRVCIVGAGLAGLCAALAVAAFQGRAHIVEARERLAADSSGPPDELDSVLQTMRSAEHRDGHPSLNFWPREELDPITRLPALNWYEGACPDIASAIAEQYRSIRNRDPAMVGLLPGIRFGCKVERYTPTGDSPPKWTLQFKPNANAGADKPWPGPFDLLIFATGFGAERQASGVTTPTYWNAGDDAIQGARTDQQSEYDNFVVSGTGDGGLIEALRFVFGPVRGGSTTAAFFELLNTARFREAVASIEYQVSKTYGDHLIHDSAPSITDASKDELAEKLWEAYKTLLLSDLPDDFFAGLAKNRTRIQKVLLWGERRTPLEYAAAPYHRLLITAAIGMGWIDYWQVERDTKFAHMGPVTMSSGAVAPRVSVSVTRTRRLGRAPSLQTQPNFDVVEEDHVWEVVPRACYIARHGNICPIEEMAAGPNSPHILQRQQALYADQDLLKPEHAKLLAAHFGQPDPEDVPAFAEETQLIVRYFKKTFGLDATPMYHEGELSEIRVKGARHRGDGRRVPDRIWGAFVTTAQRDPDAPSFPDSGDAA